MAKSNVVQDTDRSSKLKPKGGDGDKLTLDTQAVSDQQKQDKVKALAFQFPTRKSIEAAKKAQAKNQPDIRIIACAWYIHPKRGPGQALSVQDCDPNHAWLSFLDGKYLVEISDLTPALRSDVNKAGSVVNNSQLVEFPEKVKLPDFRPGDWYSHPQYGTGQVVEFPFSSDLDIRLNFSDKTSYVLKEHLSLATDAEIDKAKISNLLSKTAIKSTKKTKKSRSSVDQTSCTVTVANQKPVISDVVYKNGKCVSLVHNGVKFAVDMAARDKSSGELLGLIVDLDFDPYCEWHSVWVDDTFAKSDEDNDATEHLMCDVIPESWWASGTSVYHKVFGNGVVVEATHPKTLVTLVDFEQVLTPGLTLVPSSELELDEDGDESSDECEAEAEEPTPSQAQARIKFKELEFFRPFLHVGCTWIKVGNSTGIRCEVRGDSQEPFAMLATLSHPKSTTAKRRFRQTDLVGIYPFPE